VASPTKVEERVSIYVSATSHEAQNVQTLPAIAALIYSGNLSFASATMFAT
jgi:hypothetical protein